MRNKISLPSKAFFKVFLFSIILSICSISCKKEDPKCTAVITVVDVAGAPVADAAVRLWASLPGGGSGDIEQTINSDPSGVAKFEFKLQAIFNVDVTKGALKGSGIIKLEPTKTIDKTITIQ